MLEMTNFDGASVGLQQKRYINLVLRPLFRGGSNYVAKKQGSEKNPWP